MKPKNISANKALKYLEDGNELYINSERNHFGNISKNQRLHTFNNGQKPFAIIITCSDSRVIPENIFMKGIGELFVIRDAGNVIGDFELGSIEYAAEHLGCNLVMVMGHTRCGAIASSFEGNCEGFIGEIIKEIQNCTQGAKDTLSATKMNVANSICKIKSSEVIQHLMSEGLEIVGSIYHTNTGHVEILK